MSRSPHSLQNLLAGFDVPAPDFEITGIAMDSRRVAPGDLFVACRGHGTHGLNHLEQAVQRGAAAVVWEPGADAMAPDAGIPEVAVERLSSRVGEIAARFFGRPSERMFCAGITGTDGKTSTAWLVAQALERLGTPCAYFGTIGVGRIGNLQVATHTTPDPVSLQRKLAQLWDEGARACAMEVSSHALDQARVAGMHFDAAVLTNITRDHLDYHGTVEHYASAKRKLFERPEVETLILNRDDAYGARWIDELGNARDVIAYGIDGLSSRSAQVVARELQLTPQGLRFAIDSHLGKATLGTRLLGRFNVYNLLAALAVLLAKGVDLPAAVAALAQSQTVPGRIEGFRGPQAQPLVVVDYAHTPDALKQILGAARAHTRGRLSCVFGCGGDRDRGKRPLMGAVAVQLADRVVITDDNPRSESPQAIVEQILAGIDVSERGPVLVIHVRAAAFRAAVAAAGADDVVLVAGKGHEETQTYGGEVRAFSDRRFVAELVGAAA